MDDTSYFPAFAMGLLGYGVKNNLRQLTK